MWMFTKYGFFSIVKKGPQTGSAAIDYAAKEMMCVRARAEKDLKALIAAFPGLLEGTPIHHDNLADYYCRIFLPAGVATSLFAELAEDITYPDFKTELKRSHAQDDKLPLLNRLWEAMNDYQHQVHPGMGLYNSWRRPRTVAKGPARRRPKAAKPNPNLGRRFDEQGPELLDDECWRPL